MKNILLIALFSFFIGKTFAQDTITKNNSEKIIAKILEISPTQVKFKKFDFQDGPTYIENKSDIKMIVYSNGVKEVFEQKQTPTPKVEVRNPDNNADYYGNSNSSNKIDLWGGNKYHQNNRTFNESELHNILIQTKDKKIVALVSEAKNAKAMQYVGFAAIPLGIGAYGLLIGSLIKGSSNFNGTVSPNGSYLAGSAICLVGAIACPIASSVYKKKRKTYNRAAVKLYNEKF
ncbi:hypothetical protein BH10BAC1_BH10BAC1_21730 [soil metagenome]